MRAKKYEDDCEGCKISQGITDRKIIKLDGDWILNHYGEAKQRFLGWMALQTRYHRMELGNLSKAEAAALGKNIKKIDIALRKYWSIFFKEDRVKRVYVVYFLEGVYDKPNPSPYHLHIHLIPRTEAFDEFLRVTKDDGSSTIVAWDIYKLRQKLESHQNSSQQYLQKYLLKEGEGEDSKNLMKYLKSNLR
jgi:diadenosine tetraphosphate (Ap4A) HIT family hydrolase